MVHPESVDGRVVPRLRGGLLAEVILTRNEVGKLVSPRFWFWALTLL